jgi:hemerythrin-like domain-containing protein
MQPTEVLRREHRVIEQVLQCLRKLADRCDGEGRLDGLAATQILGFLQEFGDQWHHGKEEHHLFPLLEARGLSPQGGPIRVMRNEHDQGRRHIWIMTDAVKGAADANPDAVAEFVQHARAYVRLMQEHIRKEDEILFPLADRRLSLEDEQTLAMAFSKIEGHPDPAVADDAYLEIANELADRFEVAHTATACLSGR